VAGCLTFFVRKSREDQQRDSPVNHTHFNLDRTPISPDDPRYSQRLESQHRVAFAPALVLAALVGGIFLGLPFATSTTGFPLSIVPAGVVSVLVLLGLGLALMALAQGAWRLIPAFWSLQTSLDELPESLRLVWLTLEIGGFILWFGIGFAFAFLLA
jgi:hypothetical protein